MLNPAKYEGKSSSELRRALLLKDSKDLTEQSATKSRDGRMRRIGTAAIASVVSEGAQTAFPNLAALGGYPVGLDHLFALGGLFATFSLSDGSAKEMKDNEPLADIAEGIANAGLIPLLRRVTKSGMEMMGA